MSTKEEILEAAKNKFAKKEFTIDKEKKIKVMLCELNGTERKKLDDSMFQKDKDGKFIPCDSEQKPDTEGEYRLFKKDVNLYEEWISACIHPKFTVEELMSDAFPESLKRELYNECRKINGLSIEEAAGN